MHISCLYPLCGCGWTCWVRLYSPLLNFYRERSRIYSWGRWVGVPFCTQSCLWLGSPAGSFVWRKTLMTSTWFTFFVWVLVLVLAIAALHCPLPRRVVWLCTIWCNKYVISLLRLIFISHLSHLLWEDASVHLLLFNFLLPAVVLRFGSNSYLSSRYDPVVTLRKDAFIASYLPLRVP